MAVAVATVKTKATAIETAKPAMRKAEVVMAPMETAEAAM